MKKTFARYTYDTEVANIVKKVTKGCFGDPTGYEETLYSMPDGKLFLYTNGGAESKYTSEGIKRMSKNAAEKWIAEN